METTGDHGDGCRCDACRKRHTARVAKQQAIRKGRGIPHPDDHVHPAAAAAIIAEMRGAGMNWSQMSRVTGIDRTALNRIHAGTQKHVNRSTLDRLDAIWRDLQRQYHRPEEAGALFVDSIVPLWMIHCLMAQGWSSPYIQGRLGWGHHISLRRGRAMMRAGEAEAVASLWRELHLERGPSRRTMLAAWRAGRLPSECYLWELPIPDTRPIPGSLHPDRVREAATFAPQHMGGDGPARALAALAAIGQWPDERCAEMAMKVWETRVGRTREGFSKKYVRCDHPSHDHWALPEAWQSETDRKRRAPATV